MNRSAAFRSASIGVIALWATIGAGRLYSESKGPAAVPDSDFLTKAFAANNAEIEYSKLAEKRAASQQVKEFANRMIKDHREAQMSLARLFKERKTGVVAGLEKDVRNEVDRLSKLEGAEFDREYMKRMIEDHEKTVTLFETKAHLDKDTAVGGWVKEMLPTLKKHQELAREVQAELLKK